MNMARFPFASGILLILLSACASVPQPEVRYDPATLRFDGDKAFAIETEFVTKFPDRDSLAPNNLPASQWILEQFTSLGLACEMQDWNEVIYSLPTDFHNVVCTLPGEDPRQILVVAHHDQASTTTQGADNDGSGVAIILQLAEVFAGEGTPRYTLTFASTDAEEYGMMGSYHYVSTHPNTDDILVGMSLDNLGREYYNALDMEIKGRYRNYAPVWVPLTLKVATEAAGVRPAIIRDSLTQVLEQAAPLSFMDQGPMVAAGIPAIGLTGYVPADAVKLHFHLWHDPDDTMEHQSAQTLSAAGRSAEAFIRQLLNTDEFPRQFGPYIYFEDKQQILSGLPLWAIFIVFVAIFFLASFLTLPRSSLREAFESRKRAAPHFLSLWLPLWASILLTYAMVAVGLMDKYAAYPATTKDPHIYNPRWPAVIIFVAGLAIFLWLGHWLAAKYAPKSGSTFQDRKSLAFGVIGIAAVYILVISPFSLLFIVPLLFWLLIAGRKGARGKALDILFFLLGGLLFYAMFYSFGFMTFDYKYAFAWFLLMMFSVKTVGLWTAIAITAIVGAGLSLVVEPATKRETNESMI